MRPLRPEPMWAVVNERGLVLPWTVRMTEKEAVDTYMAMQAEFDQYEDDEEPTTWDEMVKNYDYSVRHVTVVEYQEGRK